MQKQKEIRVKVSSSVKSKIQRASFSAKKSEDQTVLFFLQNRFKLPFFNKEV